MTHQTYPLIGGPHDGATCKVAIGTRELVFREFPDKTRPGESFLDPEPRKIDHVYILTNGAFVAETLLKTLKPPTP